jgi:16S rRNA (guanine1207-N2)-methyltransferase
MVRLWRPNGIPNEPWLVCNDGGQLSSSLAREGHQVVQWNRWSIGSTQGQATPPRGSYSGALLRLPKEKAALEFALHIIASQLTVGQPLWLYGGNKEGIKSAHKLMAPMYEAIRTVGVKNHCRVWSAVRSDSIPKANVEDWWHRTEFTLGAVTSPWSTLPGVFAQGNLDPGTALLIDALPALNDPMRILDFACGPGAIGAAIRNRNPRVDLHMLDADSIALVCARINVPGAQYYDSDGWAHAPTGPFQMIVSNPPIHVGKLEDHRLLNNLITRAPQYLAPGGQLILVGQGRLKLEQRMKQVFKNPVMLSKSTRFQVWSNR